MAAALVRDLLVTCAAGPVLRWESSALEQARAGIRGCTMGGWGCPLAW
jgi:hypothetical protein